MALLGSEKILVETLFASLGITPDTDRYSEMVAGAEKTWGIVFAHIVANADVVVNGGQPLSVTIGGLPVEGATKPFGTGKLS